MWSTSPSLTGARDVALMDETVGYARGRLPKTTYSKELTELLLPAALHEDRSSGAERHWRAQNGEQVPETATAYARDSGDPIRYPAGLAAAADDGPAASSLRVGVQEELHVFRVTRWRSLSRLHFDGDNLVGRLQHEVDLNVVCGSPETHPMGSPKVGAPTEQLEADPVFQQLPLFGATGSRFDPIRRPPAPKTPGKLRGP
jgi:hypothetical protein